MEIGYSIFFAALAAAAGAIVGTTLIAMFEHQGRAALVRQTAIAVIVALAIAVAPGLISGFEVYSDLQQWISWIGITSLLSLGIAGSSVYTAKSAPARVQKYMDIVARVVPFALKNFDDIDYDDDQIISMKDLDRALMQKAFSGAETQALLQFMRKNIHEIGHDVGSYHAGGPSSGTTVTVSVINKADIESYAAKTAQKYSAWRQVDAS
ncbi:MAG: hypothetical protein C0469_15040 [Cyanobacteria bacterium DS2.3.42]|nr:hypothetical protein [Cyanobacteria bacterium DS2.3.42]